MGVDLAHWDAFGRFALEDPQGHVRNSTSRLLDTEHTAADAAVSHARVDPHVGGHVRDGGDLVESLELVKLAVVAVVEEREEVDNRVLRQ